MKHCKFNLPLVDLRPANLLQRYSKTTQTPTTEPYRADTGAFRDTLESRPGRSLELVYFTLHLTPYETSFRDLSLQSQSFVILDCEQIGLSWIATAVYAVLPSTHLLVRHNTTDLYMDTVSWSTVMAAPVAQIAYVLFLRSC